MTVLVVTLSGFPMAIGGLIGLLLGGLSADVTAFVLASAGGAMLYVVFGEVIPQAVTMQRTRLPTIVTLVGMLLGLLMCVVM
jgi:ZIP family zinc transporter